MAFQIILSKNQIQLPLQRGNVSPGDTLEVLLIGLDSSYADATATFSIKKGRANQDLSAVTNALPAFPNTGTLSQVFASTITGNQQTFTLEPAQSSALDLLSSYILEVQITKTDTVVESWQLQVTTGQDLVGNSTPSNPAQPFVRFLGSFATAPTGATGDLYFNITDLTYYFYRTNWANLGAGSTTNLSYTASPINGIVNSDTGTDATIPATDGTNAGLFLPAEKSKLTGIEAGAEVNNISDTNATDLTDGGNTALHTHDSRYYTESEVDTLLSAKENSLGFTPENVANKNINNGYAPLDSGGKIPLANLPATLLKYVGVWNASTNTPTLTNPDITKVSNVYNVSVAGTQFSISWKVGDWLIYNESGVPEKSDNSDDVVSVNGQTGVVTITKSDVGLGNVNNTSDLNKPISTATQTALDTKITNTQSIINALIFG